MSWLDELDKEGKKYRNASSKEKQSAEKNLSLTPGKKLISGGAGKGFTFGKGKGPRGIPYGR